MSPVVKFEDDDNNDPPPVAAAAANDGAVAETATAPLSRSNQRVIPEVPLSTAATAARVPIVNHDKNNNSNRSDQNDHRRQSQRQPQQQQRARVKTDTMSVDDDSDNNNDDENDNDPVVREMDVYLTCTGGVTTTTPTTPTSTTTTTAGQFYMLQYPLSLLSQQQQQQREQQQQHENPPAATAARVKPRHGLLELDHPLPVGMQVRQAAAASASMTAERTYTSHTIPIETHLCLARVLDPRVDFDMDLDDSASLSSSSPGRSALFLVPLTHICQMRPSFAHMALDDDQDDDEKDDDHDHDTAGDPASAVGEKKPLLFQRKESERAATARRNSYAYLKASQEAEEWQSLTIASTKDASASKQRRDIMQQLHAACRSSDGTDGAFATSIVSSINEQGSYARSLNYLHSANPRSRTMAVPNKSMHHDSNIKEENDDESDYGHAAAGIPGATITGTTTNTTNDVRNVVARLTQLLLGHGSAHHAHAMAAATTDGVGIVLLAPPIPFSLLRGQFDATAVHDETLFTALSVCAVLVHGNFCLHSQFVPHLPTQLQQVRTFLLYLLQTRGCIHRRRLFRSFDKINAATQQQQVRSSSSTGIHTASQSSTNLSTIPESALFALLQQLAKQQAPASSGSIESAGIHPWVLRVETDDNFLAQHPDQEILHATYWRRQGKRFRPWLQLYDQVDDNN